MPDTDTMIDKIAKLLRKAEGAKTPEEAEAFFTKAAELQAKYEIDEAMLASARGQESYDIDRHEIVCTGSYSIAIFDLACEVGRAKGFKILQRTSGNRRVCVWIGVKTDAHDAEVLFSSLMIQQQRAAAYWMNGWKDDNPWANGSDKFNAKRSFMFGFAEGVGTAMRTAAAEATRQAEEQHGAPGVGLVLVGKKDAIQTHYDAHYGNLKAGKARSYVGNSQAHSAGYSEGRRSGAPKTAVRGTTRKALGR